MKDYYKILGVERTASSEDIKKQYKRLAQKYHPDVSKEENATDKFQELQEAYNILKDAEKKARYDNGVDPTKPQQANNPYHGFSVDDIEDILDSFMRARSRTPSVQIRISLEEAFTGTQRTLNGSPFTIPAGVRTGNRLMFGGMIIVVEVLHHQKFKRANDDLLVQININAIEAMVGTKGVIKNIDGTELQFTIPAGIQPGQALKLAGKGMPNPELANVRGDLLIQAIVSVPANLTEDQKNSILNMNLEYRAEINV